MGGQQSGIHRRKNLCSKQLEDLRANSIKESQTSKYRISKTTKNAQVNQEELLVARNKEWHQEIYTEMLIEQSKVHKESRRTLSTWNTSRTIVEN